MKSDGEAMTDKEFQALTKEQREEIIRKQEGLLEVIKSALRQDRDLEREANSKVRDLEEQIALFAITILIDELREKLAGQDEPPISEADRYQAVIRAVMLLSQQVASCETKVDRLKWLLPAMMFAYLVLEWIVRHL